MMQNCLMLGMGHSGVRRRYKDPNSSASEEETKWTTLDKNPLARPDKIFDLELLERGARLPFETDSFDEVHAYETLEHFGKLGDFEGLFRTFRELWRVIKPGGLLIGSCPSTKSEWLLGDPGHTRVISPCTLSFLVKDHYDQLGTSPSSDYREYVEPCWWELVNNDDDGKLYVFGLRKVA